MGSRGELAGWLRLATAPGIGRATARRLLAALGSPERVLGADVDTLLALVGYDVVQIRDNKGAITGFEIAGVSGDIRRRFSKRRAEVEAGIAVSIIESC